MFHNILEKTPEGKCFLESIKQIERKLKVLLSSDHLKEATHERKYVFDPTYILEADVLNNKGELLFSKGSKINPLDEMDFKKKIYVIDGTSEKQITWLENEIKKTVETNEQHELARCIILSNGNPKTISNKLKHHTYFDHNQKFVNKHGIKSVPAIIEQAKDKKVLIIKEIPANKDLGDCTENLKDNHPKKKNYQIMDNLQSSDEYDLSIMFQILNDTQMSNKHKSYHIIELLEICKTSISSFLKLLKKSKSRSK